MTKGSRTLTLTRAEFDALVSAMALYQAEYESEMDARILRRARRIISHHDDVVQKWYAAHEQPRPDVSGVFPPKNSPRPKPTEKRGW